MTLSSKRTFSKLIVRVAVATVAVGVAAMILAIAVLNGFKAEVSGKQRGFFGDLMITSLYGTDDLEPEPIYADAELESQLMAIPGVESLRRFATKPGIINTNGEVEGVVLKGIDSAYNQNFLEKNLIDGVPLDFGDSSQATTQVLVSAYTARRLSLKTGDDFIMYFVQEPIRRRKFTIKGIYSTGAEELDKTYVIGSMALIARLNNWAPQEIGGYELSIQDFDQLNESTVLVGENLPVNLGVINLRDRFQEIFQWLDLLDANPQVILALMMIVAVINMISALLIIILEKTQLIGLLKAFGLTDVSLRKTFLYHGAYLIGLGLLIGNLLALSLYFLQAHTQFIKLDEAAYFVSFVPVQISMFEVFLINAAVLLIAVLVLLIPSYLVRRINPIKAIQFR